MAQRNNKYDRQLRIWGDHGQAALEHASVCLLNCGPTGSEALKNLVLGGIGSFTIVDPSRVEAADLGNNFLVSWENLGQSKARSVCALLQELNESVGAKFVEESPEALLDSNPSFFASFTLVIATQMPEKALIKLDETCRQQRVMLLVARSYGLAGLVRICIQEHDVIESKPDNPVDDLRLHKPWPELKRFVDQFDIDAKDQLEHQHIPFAIILVKVAEEWKAAHGGRLPSGSKERAEFKAAVRARKQSDDEDNYKEALASAYKVWAPPTISSELHSVLDDSAVEIHSTSTDFWILVAALKMFMANDADGDLPLDGAIPDMHSYTDYYIRLQKVYQDRAEANVSAVEANVKSILRKIARDSLSISRSTIKQFCKNARNLRVLRYRTLADEFSPLAAFKIQRLLAVEESSNVEIYILLRAVDQFAATYNRYPGIFDRELEQDVLRLKAICINLLNDIGVNGASISEDLISEFCRFGAAEIHCVASVIGGIASQEAIKEPSYTMQLNRHHQFCSCRCIFVLIWQSLCVSIFGALYTNILFKTPEVYAHIMLEHSGCFNVNLILLFTYVLTYVHPYTALCSITGSYACVYNIEVYIKGGRDDQVSTYHGIHPIVNGNCRFLQREACPRKSCSEHLVLRFFEVYHPPTV